MPSGPKPLELSASCLEAWVESYCKAELKLRRREKEEKGEKDEPGEAEEKRAPCGASPSF